MGPRPTPENAGRCEPSARASKTDSPCWYCRIENSFLCLIPAYIVCISPNLIASHSFGPLLLLPSWAWAHFHASPRRSGLES